MIIIVFMFLFVVYDLFFSIDVPDYSILLVLNRATSNTVRVLAPHDIIVYRKWIGSIERIHVNFTFAI